MLTDRFYGLIDGLEVLPCSLILTAVVAAVRALAAGHGVRPGLGFFDQLGEALEEFVTDLYPGLGVVPGPPAVCGGVAGITVAV